MMGRAPTKVRSQDLAIKIYDYLLAHGETPANVLADAVGCVPTTVSAANLMTMNNWMREANKPHLFRITSQGGKMSVLWRIIER